MFKHAYKPSIKCASYINIPKYFYMHVKNVFELMQNIAE